MDDALLVDRTVEDMAGTLRNKYADRLRYALKALCDNGMEPKREDEFLRVEALICALDRVLKGCEPPRELAARARRL
jgi:hypothetical protein